MLADRSGVTRRTLISIETGETNGSLDTWFRIAQAFDVPLGDLLEPLRVEKPVLPPQVLPDSANGCLDGRAQWDVFPDPNDRPSSLGQRLVVDAVPFNVSSQLRRPIVGVPGRLVSVFGTAMPETAVHEHSDLGSGKYDVRAGVYVAKVQSKVFAEPEAAPVQFGPEREFGLGVPSLDGCHDARAAGGHVPVVRHLQRHGPSVS